MWVEGDGYEWVKGEGYGWKIRGVLCVGERRVVKGGLWMVKMWRVMGRKRGRVKGGKKGRVMCGGKGRVMVGKRKS